MPRLGRKKLTEARTYWPEFSDKDFHEWARSGKFGKRMAAVKMVTPWYFFQKERVKWLKGCQATKAKAEGHKVADMKLYGMGENHPVHEGLLP